MLKSWPVAKIIGSSGISSLFFSKKEKPVGAKWRISLKRGRGFEERIKGRLDN